MAEETASPISLNGVTARTDAAGRVLLDVGTTMEAMGPLAPPCIVEPYVEARRRLREQIDSVLSAAKTAMGDAPFEAWLRRALPSFLPLKLAPAIDRMWDDAPSQWQRPVVETRGLKRVSLGQAGILGGGDVEQVIRDEWSRRFPGVAIPEWTRTDAEAWLAEWNRPAPTWVRWTGEIVVGSLLGPAPKIAKLAYWAGVGLYELGQTTSIPAPSGTQLAIAEGRADDLLKTFMTDFVSEVYQQMRSVRKILKAAGTDTARARDLMAATNPWLEPPVPENWDGSFAPEPEPRVASWIVPLAILLSGLGMLTVLVWAEDGS